MAAEVVVDVIALALCGLPAKELEQLEGDFAGAVFFGFVGRGGWLRIPFIPLRLSAESSSRPLTPSPLYEGGGGAEVTFDSEKLID